MLKSLRGIAINCLTEIQTLKKDKGRGHVFSKGKERGPRKFSGGSAPGPPLPSGASPPPYSSMAASPPPHTLGTRQIYTWIRPQASPLQQRLLHVFAIAIFLEDGIALNHVMILGLVLLSPPPQGITHANDAKFVVTSGFGVPAGGNVNGPRNILQQTG